MTSERNTLCVALRWRADRVHSRGHKCPSPPCPFEEEAAELRAAADAIELLEMQVSSGRAALDGCLWDAEPWSSEALVELMEQTYLILGGTLDGPE